MLTVFKVDTSHLQNPWFHSLKPMLSDRNLMPFSKHYPPLSKTVYLYRSPAPKLKPRTHEAPPPRRASAASPSPYGGEWCALQITAPTLIWPPKIIRNFAHHSRTVASVPRPPTTSEGIHSPLWRGGDGALSLVAGGRGTETTVLLWYALLALLKYGVKISRTGCS